jgi:hypothetical protein
MRQEKRLRSRWVAIILVIQGLCIAGLFVGLGSAFLSQPQVDNHSPLELTAARGAQVNFSIKTEASISGLWAAPGGIQVDLRNDALYYSQYVQVMKPSEMSLDNAAPPRERSTPRRHDNTDSVDSSR